MCYFYYQVYGIVRMCDYCPYDYNSYNVLGDGDLCT